MTGSSIHGDGTTIRAPGPRLNIANCDALKEEARARVAGGTATLTVDLSEIEFIDSSGIGALVALRKAMGSDGKIMLIGVGDFVSRVMSLTKIESLFEIQRR